MSNLTDSAQRLIDMVRWHPATPMHVVSQFDVLAYSVKGDIAQQERWVREAVQSLYVMADFESGNGPFDEPSAVQRARTLLVQVGITGLINPTGVRE